ncbi:DsbA family protein [Streptomyces aidingensis]|uniref:Thioredoxin n=1 Tax=Streptomyces aidingensis TaxID=910347 RepID=A0A1I1RUP7_9ACTN|nr:DsbA family protein [Streptomyces aidingensis]SFD38084.1 Thioredoxin [Streptomyces aidingensis]
MSDTTGPRADLEVWCDLQCPDCERVLPTLAALRERFGEALRIRLRHFPLPRHQHAVAAAEAAEEAYAQGRGDDFAAAVLARCGELAARGPEVLLEVARELGLDADEIDTALFDGRHLLAVDADHAEGQALGVKGTPTFLIGGSLLDASRSQDGLLERLAAQVAGRLPAA